MVISFKLSPPCTYRGTKNMTAKFFARTEGINRRSQVTGCAKFVDLIYKIKWWKRPPEDFRDFLVDNYVSSIV